MITENRWLVGLRFRTAGGRFVRHFYLVDDADDPHKAHETALRTAGGPTEQAARGNAPLDAAYAEIHRVVPDLMGTWQLSAHRPD